MNKVIKGFKTSELYVVAAVLSPNIIDALLPFFQIFGIEIPIPTATDQVVDLAKQLRDLGASSNASSWVAGAYIIGRTVLKWKGRKKDEGTT